MLLWVVPKGIPAERGSSGSIPSFASSAAPQPCIPPILIPPYPIPSPMPYSFPHALFVPPYPIPSPMPYPFPHTLFLPPYRIPEQVLSTTQEPPWPRTWPW